MHIHILGICGTFMGGIALLARAAGHRVTGCDANVYPPMSTQLEAAGIDLVEGYGADQTALAPDLYVIGNAISRGNALLEEILNRNHAYVSGPQWLAESILRGRWVLGVAGTHGKTTTTAMLAWILEYAGLNPSFLVGGVPVNFGVSARLTDSPFFVIEADEYDTAFCDKRSKFIHYQPRTAVLNNLEFDHADIFPDLAAIEKQFHHLVRTLPGEGLIVANGREDALRRVLARGCWTPVERFDCADGWLAGVPRADGEFAGASPCPAPTTAPMPWPPWRRRATPACRSRSASRPWPVSRASSAASKCAARCAASPSTTISPTIRPPSPPPSKAYAPRPAPHASWPCWSRAPTP